MENKNQREQMSELLNGLNDEQKKKAMACKTMEELTAFLGELGIAVTDEALDAVAGGSPAFRGGSVKRPPVIL